MTGRTTDLRQRQRRAAGLADGDVQRHRARPDDVEDAARLALDGQHDRFGDVVLVDELHHRIEAHHGGDALVAQVAADGGP